MVLQGAAWAGAVASAGGSPPVSCCAVVYAQAGGEASGTIVGTGNGLWWILICFIGALALAGWGGWQWRRNCKPSRRVTAVIAAGTGVWLWTSLTALKTGVAPHIYQVLVHPCPWCLFLPEHGAVGYVYFGLLAWIAANSMTVGVVRMTATPVSELAAAAARLRRRAGFYLMTGALVFSAAVVWPVVWWRLRFGAWLI